MYTFIVKENGPDLEIIITRSMLALASITAIVYRADGYYYLNLFLSAILLITAVFIKSILVKFRFNKILLLSVAAVILFISTHSIAFGVILIVYGYLVKYIDRKPVITVAKEEVVIKKLFSNLAYPWPVFSNVILKDNLLTLDFKNNKLIQVITDEHISSVDENEFNHFCKVCMYTMQGIKP